MDAKIWREMWLNGPRMEKPPGAAPRVTPVKYAGVQASVVTLIFAPLASDFVAQVQEAAHEFPSNPENFRGFFLADPPGFSCALVSC